MNTKRARKYNMRRAFFNKGKGPQCDVCGSLMLPARIAQFNQAGERTGATTHQVCPLNAAHT